MVDIYVHKMLLPYDDYRHSHSETALCVGNFRGLKRQFFSLANGGFPMAYLVVFDLNVCVLCMVLWYSTGSYLVGFITAIRFVTLVSRCSFSG